MGIGKGIGRNLIEGIVERIIEYLKKWGIIKDKVEPDTYTGNSHETHIPDKNKGLRVKKQKEDPMKVTRSY